VTLISRSEDDRARRDEPEATAQQYDPLGALGARPLATVIEVAAILWALVVSLFFRDVTGSPTLSALTVLLVAASAGVVIAGTHPFRAPFPRAAFVVHMALLSCAAVSSVAAQWGPDKHIWNDFMPVVLGIGVLVLAPYRPWQDLLIGGFAASAVVGISWGVAQSRFPLGAPVLVEVCLAVGPPVVLTVASAVFARTFVGLAERVQIRAGSYSVERAERDGIDRSVQEDRVTILARDVVPFFGELRSQTTLTDADRDRARAIADDIRRVMVAEADRTWLAQAMDAAVADRVGTESVDRPQANLDDPDGLVRGMDADQRTVVRTIVRAIMEAPTVDPAGVRIVVRRYGPQDGAGVQIRLSARVADSDIGVRRTFDPYLAVLRGTFRDLEVAIRPSALALRFSYDQH
jgi:hypothetical protein